MKVLVISHGPMSEGIVSTSQMIIGMSNTVSYMSLGSSDSVDQFYEDINTFVIEMNEDVLILADLMGGSPMLCAARVISSKTNNRVGLVTGVNLPMLIEVLSQIDMGNTDFDHIVSLAESIGKEGIRSFKNKGGEL